MGGTSKGARKGWITRRKNLAAIERARGRATAPGRAPGAGRIQPTDDGAVVYAAPRGPDGRVEPQAALGHGSVTDDIHARSGAFVARGGSQAGLKHVTGLRTVVLRFRTEDDDGQTRSHVRHATVDFGRFADPRKREVAIARVIADHARSLIREDSGRQVYLMLARVGKSAQAVESRRPPRKPTKKKPAKKPARKAAKKKPAKKLARKPAKKPARKK